MKSKIIIDLDNTITIDESDVTYENKKVNKEVVQKLEKFKSLGFEIVIHTARNQKTFNGNIGKITLNTVPVITQWIKKHNIPCDELIIGKPWCGERGFYVDDKSIRPDEFIKLTNEEIQKLIDN